MNDEYNKIIHILECFEPDDLIECSLYLTAVDKVNKFIEKQNSIIKNAINYIQYNNKELKNYSKQEMLNWLYGLDKCCEIKEDK